MKRPRKAGEARNVFRALVGPQLPPARLPYRPAGFAQFQGVLTTRRRRQQENAIPLGKPLDDLEVVPD
jgi:hypothetical protein